MAMKTSMRTASPFWLSLVLGFGLLLVLVGERLIVEPSTRVIFTGIGITAIGLVTAARAWTTSSTKGARRRIERTLLLCHAGTCLALVLYAATTSWGPDSLQDGRGRDAMTVLWAIVLLASIVPVILIEAALGVSLRSGFDIEGEPGAESGVDYLRARDSGWSGLSVAFAMALLMVTCQVAKERNAVRDVSYFKTSMAGESTQNIAKASPEPIRVMLFFPEANEAKEYVKGYFEQLARDTGKIELSIHDRFQDADLAAKYKVSKDGVIVLAKGTDAKEKSATIEIPEKEVKEPEVLRRSATLKTFDSKVNKELIKLSREKRKAYVMTGHGELNDPDSMPSDLKGKVPERRTTVFKRELQARNYEVKDLGLIDLVKDVPEDATMVIVLAPTAPLQDAEWATLARYLDRGGRLLIALDPKAEPSMGVLEGKLGLRLATGVITDDRVFLPQRNAPSDKQMFVVTSQFSAHASTTSLSRTVDKGLLLMEAGALEDVPFPANSNPPKKTVTLRSMESSWLDQAPSDFKFDAATEKRQKWQVGVAVEGNRLPDGKDGFRALVFSDADLFGDLTVANAMRQVQTVLVSGPLLRDSVDWLGGEEVFAGEIVSEEEQAIEHTKNEESAWFLLTVIGMPLIVLGLGLGGTMAARRRRSRASSAGKTEVTP